MQGKINVDNSALKPIGECTCQDALVALNYGSRSKSRDNMDAGSAVHDGLQKHFEGGTPDEAKAAFKESYYTYFPEEKPAVDDKLSFGNVNDIFSLYIDRHPTSVQPFEVLAAEEIVGCPLDDAGEIIIWGKRDLLIRDKATGLICPLDHKTTGQVNHYWQGGWTLSSQLPGYCFITNKETGEYCPGAYVNAIQLALLPRSTKRCNVHKMPYNECRLEHTVFKLLYYQYDQPIIDGWRSTAIMLARRGEMIKKAYPTIEHVSFAPQEGLFNRSCQYCAFHKYCLAGRPAHAADRFLSYNKFAPWEDPNARFFDWRK